MIITKRRPGHARLRTIAGRSAVPAIAVAASAAILAEHATSFAPADISAALAAIPATGWMLACAATLISFLAVGQYDALFHRWLGTGIDERRARVSGAASIAISQTFGFGLVTGTIARWRALPDLSFADAARVTHYVSVSFMAALGVLSAVLMGLSDLSMPGSHVFNVLAVAALLLGIAASLAPAGHLPFRLPPLRLMGRLLVLTAVDTGFAALALWALLPGGLPIGPAEIAAAFLLALAAGFLSGAPGGVGPFEVCLITLLPGVPEPQLIASILAFRLVYHALPACLAILVLAAPPQPTWRPAAAVLPRAPRRAEAGLAALPGHRLIAVEGDAVVAGRAGPMLVAIGDPVCCGPFGQAALASFGNAAARESYWPMLYKVTAKSAARARRAGWRVVAVSEEAWIDPASFSTEGRTRAQLRRKLRQAEAAGVTISVPAALPLAEMTRISACWARRAGGERGFSMGRFDPDYIEGQRVYMAEVDGRLVAFATFHMSAREWTLDLMRSDDDMPNGTMQAIILRALEDAARSGVARLSLAAMPLYPAQGPLGPISERPEAKGLRRFKESFAPETERLYAAAPNAALLALGGVSILAAIQFPGPLPQWREAMRKLQCRIAAYRLVRR